MSVLVRKQLDMKDTPVAVECLWNKEKFSCWEANRPYEERPSLSAFSVSGV